MRGYSQMSMLLESLNMLNMTQNLWRKNEWQFLTGEKRKTPRNCKGQGTEIKRLVVKRVY